MKTSIGTIATRAVCLICLLCPVITVDAAEPAGATYDLDIPAENLNDALQAFALASRHKLFYSSDLVVGKTSPAVKGKYTTDAALTALLSGTHLKYEVTSTGLVMIRADDAANSSDSATPFSRPTAPADDSRNDGKRRPSVGSRVAQGEGRADSGVSTLGAADDNPDTGESLQEVIVTAQKYQQRAFDVPISMSAIGGRDVQRLKITNLEDLQFYVPGLQVDDDGTSLVVTIRGISNLGGIQALVGTYLDEADLTSNSSFGLDPDTYDLQRVEVLKGPQGTLYGEGSLGGTIRYVTNKPVLNEVEMGADVTALFDQYGAPENRVEAVVNAPVIANVALRIAADLDNGGGWVDQPAANLKNINGKSLAAVRLLGRWQPRTDLTVDAMEAIHRESSGRYTGENPIGSFTQVFNLTTTPKLKNDYSISNLTVNWYPGSVTVVNSATYFTHYNNETEFGALYQFTPPPSPASETYERASPATQESLSDELRVSDNGAGRWRWMLGGLYKRIDFDSLPASYYSGVPGPPGSPLPVPYSAFASINSDSGSMFGDTNYRVLDRLVVGAGVRYFRDEENALLVGDAAREEGTFTSIDPRFYVRYGISENVNVYASAAKGFRSGGFNGLGYPPYQPEHVWTYDLGTKMRLLDGRMSVDGDVFLSDYAGYQIFGVAPPPAIQLSISSNAGNARVKGVEGNVIWMPTGRWQLSVSGDYLDARFVHISVLDSPYNVGDPLDYTPRYQVTTAAEREFRWLGRTGFARIDYTQRARTTYRNRTFGPWYYSQSDYLYLLGFHAGINWTSNLKLGFFVQNLLNDRGYTGPDVIESNSPREQPRTFGLDFSAMLE